MTLLTDGEILTEVKFDALVNPMLLGWLKKIAKAQLDKILNPPELDKPDSEGWWWFEGRMCALGVWYDYADGIFVKVYKEDLASFNQKAWEGKWSKAVVPEMKVKE